MTIILFLLSKSDFLYEIVINYLLSPFFMLFIHLYAIQSLRAIKKMSVKEIIEFIFENYYKRIGLFKENSYYSMNYQKRKDFLLLANKLIEKIPDPGNAKKPYQSFLRKKNRKSVKRSEIIIHQPKTFENPNIIDIKSVITEHPKTLH